MPLKISAFPKCYLEDIANGKMSLFEWIEMARDLDADGLELYDLFLTSFERDYLEQVTETLGRAGFAMPMMCCSPDFTAPDPDKRKREIEKEGERIRVTRFLGGPRAVARILSGQRYPEVGRRARARVGRRAASKPSSPSPASTTSSWGLRTTTRTASGGTPSSPRKAIVFLDCSAPLPIASTSACSTTRRTPSSPATTLSTCSGTWPIGWSACMPATATSPRGDARRSPPDRRHARLLPELCGTA